MPYSEEESIPLLSRLFLTATHRVGVLLNTVAGSKDTVEAGEVHPRLSRQGGLAGIAHLTLGDLQRARHAVALNVPLGDIEKIEKPWRRCVWPVQAD